MLRVIVEPDFEYMLLLVDARIFFCVTLTDSVA